MSKPQLWVYRKDSWNSLPARRATVLRWKCLFLPDRQEQKNINKQKFSLCHTIVKMLGIQNTEERLKRGMPFLTEHALLKNSWLLPRNAYNQENRDQHISKCETKYFSHDILLSSYSLWVMGAFRGCRKRWVISVFSSSSPVYKTGCSADIGWKVKKYAQACFILLLYIPNISPDTSKNELKHLTKEPLRTSVKMAKYLASKASPLQHYKY